MIKKSTTVVSETKDSAATKAMNTLVAKAKQDQARHASHGASRHHMLTVIRLSSLILLGTITAEIQMASVRRSGAIPTIQILSGSCVILLPHLFSTLLMSLPSKWRKGCLAEGRGTGKKGKSIGGLMLRLSISLQPESCI